MWRIMNARKGKITEIPYAAGPAWDGASRKTVMFKHLEKQLPAKIMARFFRGRDFADGGKYAKNGIKGQFL